MKKIDTYADLIQFLNSTQNHRERFSSLWKDGASRRRTSLAYKKDNILNIIQYCLTKENITSRDAQDHQNKPDLHFINFDTKTRTYSFVGDNANQPLPDTFMKDRLRLIKEVFDDYISIGSKSGLTKPFPDGNQYIQGTLNKHRSWIFNVLNAFFGEQKASEVCDWVYGKPKSMSFINNYGLFKTNAHEKIESNNGLGNYSISQTC